MEGEFNNLNINNSNITFTGKTDNIATSDELTATLLYQDKMGTNYSRSKRLSKAVAASGIAILMTAASLRLGTIISNGFVLNPPSADMNRTEIVDGAFEYSFTINNPREYLVTYGFTVNSETVLEEECTTSGDYEGTFNQFADGDECTFYIKFTNRFDYVKTIQNINFNTGGIKKW